MVGHSWASGSGPDRYGCYFDGKRDSRATLCCWHCDNSPGYHCTSKALGSTRTGGNGSITASTTADASVFVRRLLAEVSPTRSAVTGPSSAAVGVSPAKWRGIVPCDAARPFSNFIVRIEEAAVLSPFEQRRRRATTHGRRRSC